MCFVCLSSVFANKYLPMTAPMMNVRLTMFAPARSTCDAFSYNRQQKPPLSIKSTMTLAHCQQCKQIDSQKLELVQYQIGVRVLYDSTLQWQSSHCRFCLELFMLFSSVTGEAADKVDFRFLVLSGVTSQGAKCTLNCFTSQVVLLGTMSTRRATTTRIKAQTYSVASQVPCHRIWERRHIWVTTFLCH